MRSNNEIHDSRFKLKYVDEKRLKGKILIPLFVVLILLIASSVITIFELQKKHLNDQIRQHISGVNLLFDELLQKESKFIIEKARNILNDEVLVELWKDKDIDAISYHLQPEYVELNDKFNIHNIEFYNLEKENVLGLNYSSKSVDNSLLDSVEFYMHPFSGIYIDEFGFLQLNVVLPWKSKKEFLGYINVSINTSSILPKLKEVLGSEIILLINDKYLQDSWLEDNNELIYKEEWDYFISDNTLIFANITFFSKIVSKHTFKSQIIFDISHQNIQYKGGFIPLKNGNGRIIGKIAVLNYVTSQKADLRYLLRILLVVSLIIGVSLISFFYIYVDKIQRSLEASALALKNSEVKFRKLFEKSNDPFIIMDQRLIVDCNDAAVRLLKYKKKQTLLSKIPSELSPEKQPDGRFSAEKGEKMTQKAFDEGFNRFQWVHKKADGEDFYVDVTMTAIQYDIKKAPILYVIWRDINEMKKYEKELIDTRDKAELANLEKTEFLINMNHELITPLNAVVGLNNLLLKTDLNEVQNEYATMIKASADLISSIVKDIHDIKKIELDKIELRQSTFNIRSLLLSIMDSFEFKARQNQLGCTYQIQNEISPYHIGDPVKIRQILIILLSNAIKHTNEGHIGLKVNIVDTKDTSNILKFKVFDTGIGIPESKLPALFESSVTEIMKSDNMLKESKLGLFTVKKLVELIGGNISVESIENEGTSIEFILELTKVQKEQLEEFRIIEKSIKIESTSRSLNILVAEDNLINQKFIKVILESYGHKVDMALNGIEAMEKTIGQKYDCILMDIEMPEMNGVEATKLIRANAQNINQKTKIVAVTANTLAGDKERYLNSGMDFYIPKPVNEHTLYNVLIKIMRN